TQGVECVDADATLQSAGQMMATLDVGALPVLESDEIVGIVTDRDITVRGVAAGLDPVIARVGDVMTEGVVTCYEEDNIERAESLMEEYQVRRLVVTDANEELVGIVSLGDLAVDGSMRQAGEVLRQVSEPAEPNLPPYRVRVVDEDTGEVDLESPADAPVIVAGEFTEVREQPEVKSEKPERSKARKK
ncbi:MAG: CBS domain-containing protein, partial [Candidatus Xenobia bacterium]